MIRPSSFGYNEDTSKDNFFQSKVDNMNDNEIQLAAIHEFENMCSILRDHGINIILCENKKNKKLSDDVFPNNWISFHKDKYVIHSMYAESRRKEKNKSFIEILKNNGFNYSLLNDYSIYEEDEVFLEGTGSVVLDRTNKVAYCSISKRSDFNLFEKFCQDIGYSPITFKSYDSKGGIVYHTNVMMSIGDDFILICLESIIDKEERIRVKESIKKTAKNIIEIDLDQMESFAGNLLQLGEKGNKIIVISQLAFNSLNRNQKEILSIDSKIVNIPIPLIQKCGGGSVRCMIAEII
ncbi:MAG: citrulline utilization hydrolase CtlX [Flavobacteriaceae bacterium]|tara:strand:+ start:470 stop:1351 length:882 start_codon:yes stop_codon:yes gene_type:complete